VAHPLSQLLIGVAAIILTAIALSTLFARVRVGHNTPLRTLGGLAMAAAFILVFKGLKRWGEHRPDTELPLAGALPELAAGLLFGFLLFSAMAGLVALMGGLTISGLRGGAGEIWAMLAMGAISASSEEILFRGIIFRHLESLLGSGAALAITSVLFGAAHLANPGATWFAALAIAMEAGILLGAAYLYTRRLWLAMGIHAAWNFTQGWVFSVPVSGGRVPEGLLATSRRGPDWLTGGAFGLEASMVALAVATLAGVVLLALAARRGRMVSGLPRT
jgi:membrane protease YdiL (CAAX protease family)